MRASQAPRHARTSCSPNPYLPWLYNGRQVQMLCWYDYQWANGELHVAAVVQGRALPYSNRMGWVHSSLVSGGRELPRLARVAALVAYVG